MDTEYNAEAEDSGNLAGEEEMMVLDYRARSARRFQVPCERLLWCVPFLLMLLLASPAREPPMFIIILHYSTAYSGPAR